MTRQSGFVEIFSNAQRLPFMLSLSFMVHCTWGNISQAYRYSCTEALLVFGTNELFLSHHSPANIPISLDFNTQRDNNVFLNTVFHGMTVPGIISH